jgi:nitrate/TMAO reductase-like tetraheme cytochrome c subunit
LNTKEPKKRSRAFPVILVLLVLAGVGLLLAGGGFAYAASNESHDQFCASCHTQPESTYVERSTASEPVDLASYHAGQNTRCIDCHSGQGVFGRMQAEVLGARNAAKWYTGTAVQPAVLNYPIQDANCLKCHQDVVQRGYTPKANLAVPGREGGRFGGGGGEGEGGMNHWHEQMARWQAASADAGTCTTCHSGHTTTGSAQTGFMDPQATSQACEACHQVLRRRGGGD